MKAMKLKRKRLVRKKTTKPNFSNLQPPRTELRQHRNISTGKAMQVLAKNGLHLDEGEAGQVLDAMYFLAKLIIQQNFEK